MKTVLKSRKSFDKAKTATPCLPLITKVFGTPSVTSYQLAASFGVKHSEMVTAIRVVRSAVGQDFNEKNFHEIYRLTKKTYVKAHYLVSRDAFDLLIGTTKALKNTAVIETYFNAFNKAQSARGIIRAQPKGNQQ
jgi:uncharacterized protein YbjQ (UPF0145 family)